MAIKNHFEAPVKKNLSFWFLITFIFALGSLLRISLAVVNEEANDDHILVAEIMTGQNRIPGGQDCRECHSPKLYHWTLANLYHLLSIKNGPDKILLAQLINAATGILTLVIVFIFICEKNVPDTVKLVTSALIALNPRLIGINAQATNDSFVIFFSTAALYFLFRHMSSPRKKYLILLTLSSILAGLSKGTGIFLFPLIVLVLGAKSAVATPPSQTPKKSFLNVLIFMLLWLGLVPWVGQYKEKKHLHYQQRPGFTSVAESFCTFRLMALIKDPHITQGDQIIPRHRASLWTQLYGRTYLLQFNNWPATWMPRPGNAITKLARAIFILALWPSGLFLLGIMKKIRDWIRLLFKGRWDEAFFVNNGIHGICLVMALVFIMVNSYLFKDLGSMKIIYIFPYLLSFVYFFMEGYDFFVRKMTSHPFVLFMSDAIMSLLLSLFCIDIIYLIQQLAVA